MKLSELASALALRDLTPQLSKDAEVLGGYVSDLLSDVLANAETGAALVTVQAHMNVVAVAVHAELSCVIFAAARMPEDNVIEKAVEEDLPLFVADVSAYELAGRMYTMGIGRPIKQ